MGRVNIISLRIVAEQLRNCSVPFSNNIALNAPDGLLDRAAIETNLGRHLTEYASSHPLVSDIVPEFLSDSERRKG